MYFSCFWLFYMGELKSSTNYSILATAEVSLKYVFKKSLWDMAFLKQMCINFNVLNVSVISVAPSFLHQYY